MNDAKEIKDKEKEKIFLKNSFYINISKLYDKLQYNDLRQIYNYFLLLYNLLIIHSPKTAESLNSLINLWNSKISPMKELYKTKNSIYNIIIIIKELLNDIFNKNNLKIKDLLANIETEKEKEKEEKSFSKLKEYQDLDNPINKSLTINYNVQLSCSYFKYEDELQDINIIFKNQKIQYISIDLLIKKIVEENSFNIEICLNQDSNQTFNFINAFIFQCFGFISYEILINKLLEAHNYYSRHKKLTQKINNRFFHLIFKITKYLWDNEKYNYSFFKSSKELKSNLKKFLQNNNMKSQIKLLSEYKKEIDKEIKSGINEENNENSFINSPHGDFEFDILKYKSIDLALIISYISIKHFRKLYNHLYELNPSIKKNESDKRHLLSIVNFSNKIANFFFEEVLSYDLLNTRVKIVEKIINILIELRNLNNFNDLLIIYCTLTSISFRLPKTWNSINSKYKSKLKEFQNLCSMQECYKNIKKEEIKCYKEKKFYIPLVNIVTKHIAFYDEQCKYVGGNGLVCVEKIIGNQIEIEEFKNKLRPLLRNNKIVKIIKNDYDFNELKIVFYNICPKDYDTLEKISEKLEPEFILDKAPDTRKRKSTTDLFINSNKFINQVKSNK